jgi:hypothetical protein
MDKAIAEELWQYAHRRQSQEGAKWVTAEESESRTAEEHRLLCAMWATAANELYALAHPKQEANRQSSLSV